jgi:hypothetical protein
MREVNSWCVREEEEEEEEEEKRKRCREAETERQQERHTRASAFQYWESQTRTKPSSKPAKTSTHALNICTQTPYSQHMHTNPVQ